MLGGMSKRGDSAVRWRELVRGHASFAEVRVTPEPDSTSDRGALELHLPRGQRVIVRPGFDPQTLRALVATLERGPGAAAVGEGSG